MLSVNSDFKTIKGIKFGYLTGILYLAPADTVKGINVCPFASEGCKKACLYTAGRGIFSTVQAARIKKTELFRDNKQLFMEKIVEAVKALIWKAERQNLIPVVRLNGTSDISWENVYFDYEGERLTIMQLFPKLQFYDYTKNPFRKNIPANYHITFSRSETNENAAKNQSNNISVVFIGELPKTYLDRQVINGDLSDLRFNDQPNVVVGLTAKGRAKKDTSGFVV